MAILAAGTNLQLDAAQATYDRLQMLPELRGEVVLDDRPLIQIGRKFKEVDLVGFPFVVVVGRESSRGILVRSVKALRAVNPALTFVSGGPAPWANLPSPVRARSRTHPETHGGCREAHAVQVVDVHRRTAGGRVV